MGYRIDYFDVCEKNVTGKTAPRILMTAAFFYAFLIFVCLFWPEGREVLRLLLLPLDQSTAAAEVFACEIGNGESFRYSILSFLEKIKGYEIFH